MTVGGVAVYPLSCLPKLLLQISTVRRLLSKAVLWAPRTQDRPHTQKESEEEGRETEPTKAQLIHFGSLMQNKLMSCMHKYTSIYS